VGVEEQLEYDTQRWWCDGIITILYHYSWNKSQNSMVIQRRYKLMGL
jgi:hypothetical protein